MIQGLGRGWKQSVQHIHSVLRFTHTKPFSEIPGPKGLPVLGTLPKYLPGIGGDSFTCPLTALKKYKEFGSIVKENIIGNDFIVYLFDPHHIETMYRNEGEFPARRSHLCLEHYRLKRPEMYNDGGILPTNGEKWWKLRQSLQRPLSKPQCVQVYINPVDEIALEFTEALEKVADAKGQVENLLNWLCRTTVEIICAITLEKKVGCLSQSSDPGVETTKLITATFNSLESIHKLEWNPLYKLFPTKAYKKLEEGQDYIGALAESAIEHKNATIEKLNFPEPETLLENYLMSGELNSKDVVCAVSDMLFAGVDTTAFALAFVLYNIALNSSCQEKLYQEVINVLPKKNLPVTTKTLSKIPYLKACVKEALRLNPVALGIGRTMQKDCFIGGFQIPKGTQIVTQNEVACRLPEYVQYPETFIPERWLRGSSQYEKPHPFLVLPFGYGPRSCIARRLAEQDIYIILLRIIQNFKMEWNQPPLKIHRGLLNSPGEPLNIQFKKRPF